MNLTIVPVPLVLASWWASAADRQGLRPSWEDLFLAEAANFARRSGCARRAVGAILVGPDQRVLGQGYNGTPTPGERECMDGGCPRGAATGVEPGSSYDAGAGACTYVHAEQNALRGAGVVPEGSTLYLACLRPAQRDDGRWGWELYGQQGPCDGCSRFLAMHGVTRIVVPAL